VRQGAQAVETAAKGSATKSACADWDVCTRRGKRRQNKALIAASLGPPLAGAAA
jgi:hypothetical protein